MSYVRTNYGGEKAFTAKDLARRTKKPQYVGNALQALNILYILVALRDARIDSRFKDGQLYFNLRKIK